MVLPACDHWSSSSNIRSQAPLSARSQANFVFSGKKLQENRIGTLIGVCKDAWLCSVFNTILYRFPRLSEISDIKIFNLFPKRTSNER